MKKVFLGLGSNLGDRAENLERAVQMIGESVGKIILRSPVYETGPWGFESEIEFLNMVVCVESRLTPSGLLGRILMIESKLGRLRCEPGYSSRSIDIDILFFGDDIIKEESISVPHPRLHERLFVLVPLSGIAPGLIHPVFKKSVLTLLEECRDTGKVIKYTGDN